MKYNFKLNQLVVCLEDKWTVKGDPDKKILLRTPYKGQICRICSFDTYSIELHGFSYIFTIETFIPFELYAGILRYGTMVSSKELNSLKFLNYEDIVYNHIEILKSSLS